MTIGASQRGVPTTNITSDQRRRRRALCQDYSGGAGHRIARRSKTTACRRPGQPVRGASARAPNPFTSGRL